MGRAEGRTTACVALATLATICALVILPHTAIATESASHASVTSSSVPTPTVEPTTTPTTLVVGKSVRRRPIKLVRFGNGSRKILIVAGLHGNEAGTPVAKAFVAYLSAHPSAVPTGTELDIVVCANPDGYARRRRGNAHKVDLNRNFPTKDWRKLRFRSLSSGTRRASEPETKALVALMKRRYVRVISLHSKGGFTDGAGKGGVTLAKRIAKKAGIKRVRMSRFGTYPGSLGSYAPERYPRTAYVVWELSSRKMTSRVRAGLIEGVK